MPSPRLIRYHEAGIFLLQKFEDLKKEWPVFALGFLLVTLSLSAGLSSIRLFESGVQKQILHSVFGYGIGVSLFARFFRLCTQRIFVCLALYWGSNTLLGIFFVLLSSFALFCAYGCAWGCIFGGLSGIKTLLGGVVFLLQLLMQSIAVSLLFLISIRQIGQQLRERNIPKSSVELGRQSLPYLKQYAIYLGYWAIFALLEAVLLDGVFEVLEYTLF